MPVQIQLSQSAPTAMQLVHPEFNVMVDRPMEKGGGGSGLMGGQYLLIGVGGCFCSTLFAAAQARNIEIQGLNLTVIGTISTDSPKRFTDIELDISYDHCSDPAQWAKLLSISKKTCISVNTITMGLQLFIRQLD